MIKTNKNRLYHNPEYRTFLLNLLKERGQGFTIKGFLCTFSISRLLIVKTYQRDYNMVVFFHVDGGGTAPVHEDAVRNYWRRFIETFVGERVILLVAFDDKRQVDLIGLWSNSEDIEILEQA